VTPVSRKAILPRALGGDGRGCRPRAPPASPTRYGDSARQQFSDNAVPAGTSVPFVPVEHAHARYRPRVKKQAKCRTVCDEPHSRHGRSAGDAAPRRSAGGRSGAPLRTAKRAKEAYGRGRASAAQQKGIVAGGVPPPSAAPPAAMPQPPRRCGTIPQMSQIPNAIPGEGDIGRSGSRQLAVMRHGGKGSDGMRRTILEEVLKEPARRFTLLAHVCPR